MAGPQLPHGDGRAYLRPHGFTGGFGMVRATAARAYSTDGWARAAWPGYGGWLLRGGAAGPAGGSFHFVPG
jgi:hypothetical protein